MSKEKFIYLLYQKDFSEKGGDRYFVYESNTFKEVNSEYVVNINSFIVTHDYWLITNSLYKENEKLPSKVIDINLLARIVIGRKATKGDTQAWDISKTIKPIYLEKNDFDQYLSMYYRRTKLDENVYMLFSHKLAEYSESLFDMADKCGELSRFYALELPIFNLLNLIAAKGILVDNDIIKQHKLQIKYDFYRELKAFSEKHNVLYELPIKEDIKDKLEELGYDTDNYSIDFMIDFLPSINGYTEELRTLQKLNKSYRIFNNISSSTKRIRPIVESHSTSTSRIYFKSPNIQNISKKYRNIFVAEEGKNLSYIDFDQFEVGIMAALSSDERMVEIYTNKDAYTDLSNIVFGQPGYRKQSKILFLSYTYGMSLLNILSSIEQLNGNSKNAQSYFSEFNVFEQWKKSLYEAYESTGKIETICGNFLNRSHEGELTDKEKRSAVSHVVQGTGAYIFKNAILNISTEESVDILIPMHDAVLIQHPDSYDPKSVVNIFENTMTSILKAKITGKASIEKF
jgi:DNA polymerase I-like protein with 3'-5' exonuclease and polymerase domains